MTDITYKMGDCWQLIKDVPDETVSLVLTDPPYNIGQGDKLTKKDGKIKSNRESWGEWDDYDKEDWLNRIYVLMTEFDRVLKETGSVVMFYDKFDMTYIRDYGKAIGWHPSNYFILVKNQPVPNMRKSGFLNGFEMAIIFNKNKSKRKFHFLGQVKMYNYFRYNNTIHETDHPTEKPIDPFIRFIEIFTDKGDMVLDPFVGSGTTLLACRLTDRKGLGFEIKYKYEDMIKNRIMSQVRNLEAFDPTDGGV